MDKCKTKGFYLTLPSNSSMDMYPENTLANYKTQLPIPVHLSKKVDWEIAIVEMHYPTFIRKETMETSKTALSWMSYDVLKNGKRSKVAFTFPTDLHIGSISGFSNKLNQELAYWRTVLPDSEQPLFRFQYDLSEGRIQVQRLNLEGELLLPVSVSTHLATQMGFLPPIKNGKNYNKMCTVNDEISLLIKSKGEPPVVGAKKAVGLEVKILPEGEKYANAEFEPFYGILSNPVHMYVYCDLVEPNLVGDACVPLLRIVNINDEEFDKNLSVVYNKPHYVPLLKREFQTIEIDIRGDTGERFPFESGKLAVKVHIRPEK